MGGLGKTSSTKEQIFHYSMYLFADKGYDNVSIKNIAETVGIKAASIYNHYESKEAILANIYGYFKEHCFLQRLTPQQYEPILRTGSAKDIMDVINYPIATGEAGRLYFAVVRIIWSRLYIDKQAGELYHGYVMQAGRQYVVSLLERCVELGRFVLSAEEMETFANLVLAARVFAASAVVTDPNQFKWRIEESNMLDMLAGLLEAKQAKTE